MEPAGTGPGPSCAGQCPHSQGKAPLAHAAPGASSAPQRARASGLSTLSRVLAGGVDGCSPPRWPQAAPGSPDPSACPGAPRERHSQRPLPSPAGNAACAMRARGDARAAAGGAGWGAGVPGLLGGVAWGWMALAPASLPRLIPSRDPTGASRGRRESLSPCGRLPPVPRCPKLAPVDGR